jgi:hypothetical protein
MDLAPQIAIAVHIFLMLTLQYLLFLALFHTAMYNLLCFLPSNGSDLCGGSKLGVGR